MRVKRSYADISRLYLRLYIILLILLSWSICTDNAQATIYWQNRNGTANGFDWRNGGSDYGLFGNPILVGGNNFVFFPSNFRAESANGQSDIVSDRVQFQVIAHTGKEITGIRITEYGDYGILGRGSVSVSGTMFLTDLTAFNVYYDEFSTQPESPIRSGQGTWTGQVSVTDLHCTNLQVVLDNNLMAISFPGSTVFIQKKVMGAGVDIEIIVPEPATVALLAVGSAVFVRRKKKHN